MRGKLSQAAGALALAMVGMTGCGDDSSSQSDARPAVVDASTDLSDARSVDAASEARFSATWNLLGGCLAGDEVELVVNSTFDGRTTTNRFPCTATSGTSDHVGEGSFNIQLRVIDNELEIAPDAGPLDAGAAAPAPGPLVAESSLLLAVPSVLGSVTPLSFEFPTNTATIGSAWSFATDSIAESCADVGAVFVDLEYERVGVGLEYTIRHACTDLADASSDLATGLYLVRAKALDAGGSPVRPQLEQQTPLFVGNRGQAASFSFVPAP